MGFPVVVPETIRQGYQLIGGRLCISGNCRAAWILYRHGTHTASLFILNAGDIDFSLTELEKYTLHYSGNTVKIWKEKDQIYALVT